MITEVYLISKLLNEKPDEFIENLTRQKNKNLFNKKNS